MFDSRLSHSLYLGYTSWTYGWTLRANVMYVLLCCCLFVFVSQIPDHIYTIVPVSGQYVHGVPHSIHKPSAHRRFRIYTTSFWLLITTAVVTSVIATIHRVIGVIVAIIRQCG